MNTVFPPAHLSPCAGYVFVQFDEFWRSSEPESIMQFQLVEEAFFEQLKEQLLTQQDTLNLRLQ